MAVERKLYKEAFLTEPGAFKIGNRSFSSYTGGLDDLLHDQLDSLSAQEIGQVLQLVAPEIQIYTSEYSSPSGWWIFDHYPNKCTVDDSHQVLL